MPSFGNKEKIEKAIEVLDDCLLLSRFSRVKKTSWDEYIALYKALRDTGEYKEDEAWAAAYHIVEAGDFDYGRLPEKRQFDFDPNEPRDSSGEWTEGGGGAVGTSQPAKKPVMTGKQKPSAASKTHPKDLRRRLRTLQEVHERIVGKLAKSKVEEHEKLLALHNAWHAAPENKKNVIRNKIIKKNSKLEKINQKITQRQDMLVERARKIVEVPKSSKSQNTYQADNSEIGSRADVREGVALFDRYASRDVDIPQTIDIKDGGDRAHYSGKIFNENAVYVDKDKSPSTFAHEMGHALEDHHPAIMRASVDFLSRRTLNDRVIKLSDFYRERGRQMLAAGDKRGNDIIKYAGSYGDREVTKLDNFIDPYVGKQYVGADGKHYATEILSMGIERLHKDPLEFQKNDPDYFDHVINCLRGRYQ